MLVVAVVAGWVPHPVVRGPLQPVVTHQPVVAARLSAAPSPPPFTLADLYMRYACTARSRLPRAWMDTQGVATQAGASH